MKRTKREGYMDCPLCPVTLQPLHPKSSHVKEAQEWAAAQARHHRQAHASDVPIHGPAALSWLALVIHHKYLHSSTKLTSYLEAYLAHQ